MGTPQKQMPKGEARRAAIMAEARRGLLEDGYPAVSLRMIASTLGISIGNLQYYFATKDDLIEAVIAAETDKPIGFLWEIAWVPENADQCIRKAVESLLRHFASDAGKFYAIAEFLALHNPRYARLKADGYAFVLGYVVQVVGVMAPHLAPASRAGLARILVALIDGASLQLQFARTGPDDGGIDAPIDDVSMAMKHLLESWE